MEEEISIIRNEQLNRSLQVLGSATSSPAKSLFRLNKKPGTGDNLFESELAGGDFSRDKKEFRLFRPKLNENESTFSLRSDDSRKFGRDATAFNSVPYGHQPIKNAQDRLFIEFLEALQNNPLEQDVFNSISDFLQICNDTLDLIRSSEDRQLAATDLQKDHRWQEIVSERNTWRLVYALYQDRCFYASYNEEDDKNNFEFTSEKEITEKLYKKDKDVREAQVVIDWLEQNATECDGIVMELFTDKTIGWENTLHQLQNENIPYRSSREVVKSLDPDAPRREGRPLHDLDKEDDERLIKQMFMNIRAGRLDQAQSMSVLAGQAWRAATLEGWRLYHDPNYKQPVGPSGKRELLPIEGNHHRDIWKKVSYRLCNDLKHSALERACYGPYCGHLKSLLDVAKTWEDYLWSYMKVFVDVRVEREIRENSSKTYVEIPQDYWHFKLSVDEILQEIASSKNVNVKKEANSLERIVQKYLILDEVEQLMQEVHKWIQSADLSVGNEGESLSSHWIRFLTHLVLFFRKIGRNECEDVADLVIEAYVKILIEIKDSTLVAYYVSQLPQADQVYYYAAFLEEITDSDERSACLQAAESAGLDIDAISKTVVENIRQQTPSGLESNMGVELTLEVSPEDLNKISALDWLLYYPTQRPELLIQANALIATFLSAGNIQAARMALNKIPDDSIDLVTSIFASDQLGDDTFINGALNNTPKHIRCAIKEFLCYKTYLDADESFSDWFQHFHRGKPQPPELKPGATFTEKISFEHKNKQYNMDLQRWRMAMENQTKTTKTFLLNILTFPEGWLVDEVDLGDTKRNAQLNGLRSIIIPKVTLLVHSVLHSMEEYAACVSLCDLIADPNRELFKVFSKTKLRDFMEKVAESSVALLNEKKDPWGYPLA